MVQFRRMSHSDVEEVSRFISEMNNLEDSHIGYCGTDPQEIAHSLDTDVTDIQYSDSFVLAYEEDSLIGVLGFDADLESNNAEIWGPFIKKDNWDTVYKMWDTMLKLLPTGIRTLYMFLNKKNGAVRKLADERSFQLSSEETILEFTREASCALQAAHAVQLTDTYISDMKNLHDESFPNTYYSGQQIIERIHEHNHRKVFVTTNTYGLSGYIYVEAEPEFGEAGIEFFAVKSSERGKGLGGQLLTAALTWIFSFESIHSITLCVNADNDKAIHLYKKVGFTHRHDLCAFYKNI